MLDVLAFEGDIPVSFLGKIFQCLSKGGLVKSARGPSAPAISLNFSPSGRRLISAGPDGVRLWAPAALR